MENQHRKIKGYKELDQSTIDKMNEIKELAAEVGELIQDLQSDVNVDQRWLAIGKTELQQGFMALTRAVTRPEFF